MRNAIRFFLAVSIFASATAPLVAAPSRGSLGDPIETVTDKFDDCRPKVKEAIQGFRKAFGDVHFSCKNGSLQKLLVPREAPLLEQTPEAFALSNLALFEKPLPEKRPTFAHMPQFDSKFQSTAYQTFGGFKIWDGGAFKRMPVDFDAKFRRGRYGMFHVQLVDTSSWHFRPQERVKCEEAVGLAKAVDLNRGITRKQYSCQAWPQVVLRSCTGGPGLVQFVEAFNEIVTDGESFFVDTATGKVCKAQF